MIKDIQTTENYWDCECISDYIHLKSQILCTECGQHQDDMPDSRIDEVAQMSTNASKICKDCLRIAITNGLDTTLFNKTFTVVEASQCCQTFILHKDSDGFPICHNDCANWPQTTLNSGALGCACECHE